MNINVSRAAAVKIDGEGIFRHVGVVQPETFDVFALGPGVETLQVLAQSIREHLRAGPARPIGAHRLGGPLLAGLVQIEAQQPALDGAVVKPMGALGIDPEVSGERRIAGENRGLPSLESVAQRAAELRVQGGQARLRADAFAVRRIRDDQARVALRANDLGERTLLHVQPAGNPGLLAVGDRHAHRVRVHVRSQYAARLARGARAAPFAGLGAQLLPERGIVAAPAREAEIFTVERRRRVRRNQGCLGEKGAGTAHRIEQRAAAIKNAGPTGAQQHGRGNVLFERRAPAFAAIAAPVQALAGKIHG